MVGPLTLICRVVVDQKFGPSKGHEGPTAPLIELFPQRTFRSTPNSEASQHCLCSHQGMRRSTQVYARFRVYKYSYRPHNFRHSQPPKIAARRAESRTEALHFCTLKYGGCQANNYPPKRRNGGAGCDYEPGG